MYLKFAYFEREKTVFSAFEVRWMFGEVDGMFAVPHAMLTICWYFMSMLCYVCCICRARDAVVAMLSGIHNALDVTMETGNSNMCSSV